MISLAISTPAVVLLVVGGLIALLALGGIAAAARGASARDRELLRQLEQADQALAQAHASDKGWERSALEAAARRAVAERFGNIDVDGLQLVQVLDRPGTDADQAVFRVQTRDGEHRITLGRTNGVWGPA